MMICGIPDGKSRLAAKFIRKSLPFMTSEDQDGVGYAALGSKGVFGERWLNFESALKSRSTFTKDQQVINKFFENAVGHNYKNYTRFGEGTINSAKTILFHTRYATNSKTMTNTHPFVIKDTALIHNGVILNDSDIMRFHEDKISTCDSEAILQEYLANNVSEEPEAIQEMADLLDGWYACGVLTKDVTGRHVVDIFKCAKSNLVVGLVPEIQSFVFCTELDILKETAKAAKMSVVAYDDIVGGKLIRMDATTGEKIKIIEFKAEPDKKMLKTISKTPEYSPSYNNKDWYHEDSWNDKDEYSKWDYVTEKFPAA